MPLTHIFGYGSLICPSSRLITGSLTSPQVCKINGYSRSWSAEVATSTAVGVNIADKASEVYGVLCAIDGDVGEEINKFDVRVQSKRELRESERSWSGRRI